MSVMFSSRRLEACSGDVVLDVVVDGPACFVFESDPEVVLTGEVTQIKHCRLSEVTDEDARAEGGQVAADLQEGIRRHYPEIDLTDEVDVITFRIDPECRA